MLKRITTEFIDIEDRIRLSGECENTEQVILWFTQRLLQRLLPLLFQWLEGQPSDKQYGEIMQSIALQAAKAALPPERPIQPDKSSATWLVSVVDLTPYENRIDLVFRGIEGQRASLRMEATPLRQWLNIIHAAYCRAGWNRGFWPAWFQSDKPTTREKKASLH